MAIQAAFPTSHLHSPHPGVSGSHPHSCNHPGRGELTKKGAFKLNLLAEDTKKIVNQQSSQEVME